uniref:Uncharacterized protein n=2 Tax=Terfezia boudieri TaxID=82571 RepID=Q06BT2_9PEZI|nr:hypothetical protein [Terfezia boudieri]ABI93792.1 hypothetical protein [Terfezia boudieri]
MNTIVTRQGRGVMVGGGGAGMNYR